MKRNTRDRAGMSTSNSAGVSAAQRASRSKPLVEALESRQLLSAVTDEVVTPSLTITADAVNTHVTGYTASQIRAAYGITGTGAGQTIAIVDAYNDPSIAADLKAFNATMGLANSTLSVVSQTGSTTALPTTDAGWALEIALDVEWAHAVAPGAKILLVEANSSSFNDLLTAVNYARRASGVSVVSMSWGASEFFGETSYDSYFTTPSGHTNVTFVAASGDDGYVTWPSVSANVLSVGGTALSVTTAGTYGTETGWAYSGGGYSRYVSEPSYQSSVQSTGRRTTPDVAYDASTSTGFAVYDSVSYSGQTGWFQIGGTSAGAPQWAGLIAQADAARAASGLGSLATAGVLSALYSTYSSTSTYSTDFHDVTSGGSFGRGGKLATAGYDLVTGLGSPKATGVISTLLSYSGTAVTATTLASTSATSTTVTQTHQRRGGPFDEMDETTIFTQRITETQALEVEAVYLGEASPFAGQDGDVFGETSIASPAPQVLLQSTGTIISARAAVTENALTAAARPIDLATHPASQTNTTSAAVVQANAPAIITLTTSAGSFAAHLVPQVDTVDSLQTFSSVTSLIGATSVATEATASVDWNMNSSWAVAAAATTVGAIGFFWWWTDAERELNRRQIEKSSPFASTRLIESGPLY